MEGPVEPVIAPEARRAIGNFVSRIGGGRPGVAASVTTVRPASPAQWRPLGRDFMDQLEITVSVLAAVALPLVGVGPLLMRTVRAFLAHLRSNRRSATRRYGDDPGSLSR